MNQEFGQSQMCRRQAEDWRRLPPGPAAQLPGVLYALACSLVNVFIPLHGLPMHFQRCLTLSESEKDKLLGWGKDIFNTEAFELTWRPKSEQLVLYDGDEPVSTCGLLRQHAELCTASLDVGGIGGVVTRPGFRGQGHAGRLLAEALRIFREEWQLDAGMLFCREALVAFYRERDWQRLEVPVRILQPSGTITCPTPVMVYPLHRPWPNGPVHIDSLPW
ncbi:GNAT family N-acetyltransferase [Proteobacteria bacterium 005FR1]|nr:GNAT family N-acetyltransferase [Proteobacteria bacterium 005FR1]